MPVSIKRQDFRQKSVEKIYKAIRHRPLHPDDEAYKKVLGQLTLKINRLKEKIPLLRVQNKLNMPYSIDFIAEKRSVLSARELPRQHRLVID